MYKAVVFDLDGTLLNTLDDLMDSVNFALDRQGLSLRTYEEIRRFVGNGIRNLIFRSLPDDIRDEEKRNELTDVVLSDFEHHYRDHCADKTAPYPGVCGLMKELRAAGVRIGVLSNKIDSAVQELMHVYFEGLVDEALGERRGVPKKPAPDSTLEIIGRLGAVPEDVLYVGDSEVDIATAKNAGVDAIFVDWGFRDRDVLIKAGAPVVVSETEELKRAVLHKCGCRV